MVVNRDESDGVIIILTDASGGLTKQSVCLELSNYSPEHILPVIVVICVGVGGVGGDENIGNASTLPNGNKKRNMHNSADSDVQDAKGGKTDGTNRNNCSTRVVPVIADDRT